MELFHSPYLLLFGKEVNTMSEILKNVSIKETLRKRIDDVISEVRAVSKEEDPEKIEKVRKRLMIRICCTLCIVLHGYIDKKISREDTIEIISLFIVNPNRINNLLALTQDESKCYYEEIKKAIQLDLEDETFSDILLSSHIESEFEAYCAPTINRILINEIDQDAMKELIQLRKECDICNLSNTPLGKRARLAATINKINEKAGIDMHVHAHDHNSKESAKNIHNCDHHDHKVKEDRISQKANTPKTMTNEEFANKFVKPNIPNIQNATAQYINPNSPEGIVNKALNYCGTTGSGYQENPFNMGTFVRNPNYGVYGGNLVKSALNNIDTRRSEIRSYIDFGPLPLNAQDPIVDKIYNHYDTFSKLRNMYPSIKRYYLNLNADSSFSIYNVSPLNGKRYDMVVDKDDKSYIRNDCDIVIPNTYPQELINSAIPG